MPTLMAGSLLSWNSLKPWAWYLGLLLLGILLGEVAARYRNRNPGKKPPERVTIPGPLRVTATSQTAKTYKTASISILVILLVFALGNWSGWVLREAAQQSSALSVKDAVVKNQNGDKVTFYYEADVKRKEYTLDFCIRDDPRKPQFQPGQIIQEMIYTRVNGCETVPQDSSFKLQMRRVNGIIQIGAL